MIIKRQKLKTVLAKVFLAATLFFNCFMVDVTQVYAADIGKKVGEWATEQLFWIGLVILAIAVLGCLWKKAWVAMLITAIGGSIGLIVIQDPELLSGIGRSIFDAIFNS